MGLAGKPNYHLAQNGNYNIAWEWRFKRRKVLWDFSGKDSGTPKSQGRTLRPIINSDNYSSVSQHAIVSFFVFLLSLSSFDLFSCHFSLRSVYIISIPSHSRWLFSLTNPIALVILFNLRLLYIRLFFWKFLCCVAICRLISVFAVFF